VRRANTALKTTTVKNLVFPRNKTICNTTNNQIEDEMALPEHLKKIKENTHIQKQIK
jgi:hypothetical protein